MVTSNEMITETADDFEEPKLKLREKMALVLGNAPNTFHYQMIQTYLLFDSNRLCSRN